MKNLIMLFLLIITTIFSSCDSYISPDPTAHKNDSISYNLYVNQFENFADFGQYNLPKQKLGKDYWIVTNSTSNTNDYSDNSLRTSLIAESIIGLTALAVNEGRGSTMIWSDVSNSDFIKIRDNLNLTYKGTGSVWDLLANPDIKQQINGYVLCNFLKQESVSAATVAAHVYQSIIVDTYNEAKVKELGYTMTYNASNKTTADAWAEFKSSCNNNALVFMPTLTANNKGFAIANRLMFVNYNKKYATSLSGTNAALFDEVLAWLKPLSPVIGWEQNVGEQTFVDRVSKSGNLMVPADWNYNLSVTSANYENVQSGLAKVTNPKYITFSDTLNYASFFLTDGDNIQWMMNNFRTDKYFLNQDNLKTKMSFGLPVCNLSMMAPYQLSSLLSDQAPNNSIIEYGGQGYTYADDFGANSNRTDLLGQLAESVSHHMRQHRVKVLGLFCNDVISDAAKEAYQAYISKNDQLIGIIAVQFDPYAGGNGQIMWFKNSKGYDIPVITTRYSIWNFGNTNTSNQGTPAFVASQINNLASTQSPSYSLVAVHAWSAFSDIGTSTDLTAENLNGSYYSATPVSWCMRRLKSNVQVVNTEELIWQLRMHTNPDQTKAYLNTFY